MDLSRTILVDYAFQHINPSFLSFAREYSQFILTSRIFGVKSWTFNNIRAKVPTNVQKRYHGLKMIIADNKTNVLQLSWRYLKANFIKCISEIGLYLFQNLIFLRKKLGHTYIKSRLVSNTDVIISNIHNFLLNLAFSP